mmetsp:Transcript_3927/g.13791  ORF Transcript_3927/g.13791 Transcript_3927/m.13791 type:complete len:482 (+) Transcript_3927:723-2168(+)
MWAAAVMYIVWFRLSRGGGGKVFFDERRVPEPLPGAERPPELCERCPARLGRRLRPHHCGRPSLGQGRSGVVERVVGGEPLELDRARALVEPPRARERGLLRRCAGVGRRPRARGGEAWGGVRGRRGVRAGAALLPRRARASPFRLGRRRRRRRVFDRLELERERPFRKARPEPVVLARARGLVVRVLLLHPSLLRVQRERFARSPPSHGGGAPTGAPRALRALPAEGGAAASRRRQVRFVERVLEPAGDGRRRHRGFPVLELAPREARREEQAPARRVEGVVLVRRHGRKPLLRLVERLGRRRCRALRRRRRTSHRAPRLLHHPRTNDEGAEGALARVRKGGDAGDGVDKEGAAHRVEPLLPAGRQRSKQCLVGDPKQVVFCLGVDAQSESVAPNFLGARRLRLRRESGRSGSFGGGRVASQKLRAPVALALSPALTLLVLNPKKVFHLVQAPSRRVASCGGGSRFCSSGEKGQRRCVRS